MLVDETRTFFCSELVAKAFKIAGVLEDDDTACSRFMPASFSAKGQNFLKLNKGVEIEEELLVLKYLNDEHFLFSLFSNVVFQELVT